MCDKDVSDIVVILFYKGEQLCVHRSGVYKKGVSAIVGADKIGVGKADKCKMEEKFHIVVSCSKRASS